MGLPCKIEGHLQLGADQQNNTYIWYVPENRWLSMEEFAKCEIGNNVKIVLRIQNEKVKSKNVSTHPHNLPTATFFSATDFSLAPSSLKLDDFGITNYEQQPEPETNPTPPPDPTSLSDVFTGAAATLAMILSVAQQVRQKKKEAEANLCCNNNKIEINKFDAKLQKLETEIKTKSEKDNKGVIAEILEARKEIKEIKEEFESGKEDLQKVIEIIETQMKNK